MDQGSLLMIIVIIAFGGMMWWQSRSSKKRQTELQDFRQSLEPGIEVVSIGGVIGKVVSVDTKYEEIVIDSDGSLLRFTLASISKQYERPAYIDDDHDDNSNVDDDTDNDVEVEVVETEQPQLDTVDDHETDVADETTVTQVTDPETVPTADETVTVTTTEPATGEDPEDESAVEDGQPESTIRR